MAEKYLTYSGLKTYDTEIKNWTIKKLDGIEAAGTILGYYYNGNFYEDGAHAILIEGKENFLYVDQHDNNKLYVYNGSSYELVSDSGSASVSIGETTVACGGIAKGTDLTGKSLQEILEMMISPYVAPSGVVLSVRKDKVGYVEYGDSCNVTGIQVSWTNGSVPVTSVSLTGSATAEEVVPSGNSSILIDFEDIVLTTGTASFTVNLHVSGHDDVTSSVSTSNNFVYPIYYGASDLSASDLDASAVQSLTKLVSSGRQTLSYTTVDAYPVIASTRRLSRVTDEQGVNDYTSAFSDVKEISLSSSDPIWGPQTYYVYTGSRATLNNFKFIFTFV